MQKIHYSYTLLLVACSFVVGAILIWFIYKKYAVNFKLLNRSFVHQDSTSITSELRKISFQPFLFGLENISVSKDDFYFDNENFYVVNKKSEQEVFKLTDITEISETDVKINNRRIWQVKVKQANRKEISFKFAHNYTLWNNHFVLFYEKIKGINPTAVKTEWNIWSM